MKKVVPIFDLGLIGTFFFLHFFTIGRYENTFMEYDYHIVIILLSSFLICRSIRFLSEWQMLQVANSKLSYLILAVVAYITISALVRCSYDNKILKCIILLTILYFDYLRILARPTSTLPLALLFLTGVLFCQGYVLLDLTLFSSHVTTGWSDIKSGVNACYLAVTLPFTLNLIFFKKRTDENSNIIRCLAVLSTVLSIYLSILSMSRTAWVASICGGTVVLVYHLDLHQKIAPLLGKKILKKLMLIFGFTIVFIAFCLLYHIRPGSVHGRLLIYEVGIEMVNQNFFFGTGLGTFEYRYNLTQAEFLTKQSIPYAKQSLADNTFYAFNEFLRFAIEYGFFALCLLIGLLVQVYIKCRSLYCKRSTEGSIDLKVGAIGSLFSLLICSIFSYPLHVLSVAVLTIFYLAIISTDQKDKLIRFRLPSKYLCILFLLFVILGIRREYQRMNALKQWETADLLAFTNRFKQARPIYESIYPILDGNGRFLFNYGAELFIDGHKTKSIGILEKSKKIFSHSDLYLYLGRNYDELGSFAKAEENYKVASSISPSKFTPLQLLLELYIKYEKHDKARNQAMKIVTMQVKIPSETINKIKSDAREYLKKNIKIQPSNILF